MLNLSDEKSKQIFSNQVCLRNDTKIESLVIQAFYTSIPYLLNYLGTIINFLYQFYLLPMESNLVTGELID